MCGVDKRNLTRKILFLMEHFSSGMMLNSQGCSQILAYRLEGSSSSPLDFCTRQWMCTYVNGRD